MSEQKKTELVCSRCGQPSSNLHWIRGKAPGRNRIELDGPFDRLCAYEQKFGNLPKFKSYPTNTPELLFRYLTAAEIPSERTSMWRLYARMAIIAMVVAFLVSCFLIVAVLVPIWTFLIVFVQILISSSVMCIRIAQDNKQDPFSPFIWMPESYLKLQRELFCKKSILHDCEWGRFAKLSTQYVVYSLILLPRISAVVFTMALFVTGSALTVLIIAAMMLAGFAMIIPLTVVLNPIGTVKGLFQTLVWAPIRSVWIACTMPEKFGADHISHFEAFWQGQITKEDHSPAYYQVLVLIASIIGAVFLWLNSIALPECIAKTPECCVILYLHVLTAFIFIDMFREPVLTAFEFLLGTGDFFGAKIIPILLLFLALKGYWTSKYRTLKRQMAPPDDVLELARKKWDRESQSKLSTEDEEEESSRRTGLLSSMPWAKMKPSMGIFARPRRQAEPRCEICKQPVIHGIQCKKCGNSFHHDHLESYFELHNETKCPVCGNPMELDSLENNE